tara:strand:- start:18453 stop:20669 length:2217 start_codon:yes stop_codon:yes gene_type:complete
MNGMNKYRLLKPILIVVMLLASANIVSANDADGDGTDDLYDDFPNDPCADTDTDGDGLPDTVVSGCSSSSVIAYTSFEDPFTNGAKYYDTGNQSLSRYLWNNANEPHVAHNQTTGSEMGFSLFYRSTGGVGLTDGDFFGTANYTGTVGNYTEGSQGYQMGDVDGATTLTLDSVNADSMTLDIFVQGGSGNSYESSDNLVIRFVGASSTVELVNVTGATGGSNNGGFATYMGVWTSFSADISSLGLGNLEIEFTSNSQTESVYIDNVAFTSSSQLVEDTDDDNDGWDDVDEGACGTDPLDSNDVPSDSNANGVCDAIEGDDFDGDGIPNDSDPDDDNDGYDDDYDAFPLDPTEWDDADGDGIGSNADTDDDGDGWADLEEADCLTDASSAFSVPADHDGDWVCDIVDADDDDDGVDDDNDCAPYDASISSLDCNGVCGGGSSLDACGVCDGDDSTCSDCAGVPNGDAVIDACGVCGGDQSTCGIDSDEDGVNDDDDAFPSDPSEWADTDGDGVGDNADTDDDGDGWSDQVEDACGSQLLDSSSVPVDSDGDGDCDALDSDDDGDGVVDSDDAFPSDPSEWADTDGDGIGNNADGDDDGDGWGDTTESECDSDPMNGEVLPEDIDGDGACDIQDPDDDGDGVADGDDAFPLDKAEWLDTDGDGLGDNSDQDDDGDQFTDEYESECMSDPLDPDSSPSDSDGDGICDEMDVFDDNDTNDTPGFGLISAISVLSLAALARRE